ncbi:pancreatic progenitor cell differentiation and proliferation factor A isoform X2 [Hippocampus zosterae]|uniref:pancreatic progenitor cell differentiation and proliferation factor A isoform X2 n=1 Tax=Hippocampus zosterae TaxID=109293 RepID=UPI00223DEE67|nr:pancreatic progenitor cell differentiation and proliferation factor A isoform X2 [Hippocampus zosterae]
MITTEGASGPRLAAARVAAPSSRERSSHTTLDFQDKILATGGPPFSSRNPKPKSKGNYTVANGQVTCIAREMLLKRQLSENGDMGKSEASSPPPPASSSSS